MIKYSPCLAQCLNGLSSISKLSTLSTSTKQGLSPLTALYAGSPRQQRGQGRHRERGDGGGRGHGGDRAAVGRAGRARGTGDLFCADM